MQDGFERDQGKKGRLRRRDAALDALEHIFLTHGFRTLTMDDLASRLRCSKRTLYELAPNRRILFLTIVRRWTARIREKGDAAAASENEADARLAVYLMPAVTESGAVSDAFLADLLDFAEAREELEAHQRARVEGLRRIVDAGISDGCFELFSSQLVAEICLAAIERINDPAVRVTSGLSFSEAFDQFYRVVIGGLGKTSANRGSLATR